MEFINGSGRVYNTVHPNTFEFYEEFHRVIHREPVEIIDPETRGLMASIGIRKGRPFEPDDHIRDLLIDAVAVGNATARTLFFQTNARTTSSTRAATGSGDSSAGTTGSCWTEGSERNLDARTAVFYMATLNTPAMTMKMVGAGSQYAWGDRDSSATTRRGQVLPAHPPTECPGQELLVRGGLRPPDPVRAPDRPALSEQEQPDRRPIENADGSIDLYFGPEGPNVLEANWTQTVPGKGWFTLLRLYGPLEPWFDQTWRPGEFELI